MRASTHGHAVGITFDGAYDVVGGGGDGVAVLVVAILLGDLLHLVEHPRLLVAEPAGLDPEQHHVGTAVGLTPGPVGGIAEIAQVARRHPSGTGDRAGR